MPVVSQRMPTNSVSIMLAFQAEKLGLKKSVTRNELPSRKTRNGLPRKDRCAYDQAMRYLAVISLTLLLLTGCQTTTESFQPDLQAAAAAYKPKDYATALRHLRPLAKQGDAPAQHDVGVMYEMGWGVPKDLKEAVRWFRLAAKQGNNKAQKRLASLEKKLRASATIF